MNQTATGGESLLKKIPWAIIAIILVNIIAAVIIKTGHDVIAVAKAYGFKPGAPVFSTTFTALFIHLHARHLLVNMLFILVCGIKLEEALGRWKVVLFYIIAGVLAWYILAFVKPKDMTAYIGASGAASAMMGAFLGLITFYPVLNRLRLVSWVVLSFYLVYQLISAFVFSNQPVAFPAHIGGFMFGILFIFFIRLTEHLAEMKILRISGGPVRRETEQEISRQHSEFSRLEDLVRRRFAEERRQEGLSMYENMRELYPDETRDPHLQFEAAETYGVIGQFDRAVAEFTDLVHRDPEHEKVDQALHQAIVFLMEELDDPVAARTMFDTLVRLYPDSGLVKSAREALENGGKTGSDSGFDKPADIG